MKFTNKSKQLINFIKDTDFVSKLKQNKPTSKILLLLYQKIFESYLFLKKRKQNEPIYNLTITKINHASQIIKPKKLSYSWMPVEIIQQIETHISQEISYSFSFNERNIQLFFMEEKPRQISKYEKCIDLIIMWLYFIYSLSPNQCANKLIIYCYLG